MKLGPQLFHVILNRKIIFLLFLLKVIVNQSAFAQEFEIKSFRKDPSDLSAVKYSRKDVNNLDCAIIKVRTNLTGLSFDCNLKITGNVEVKSDEVWLYVSPKEKRLKFMKDGFISIDYLIPEPVGSSIVYILELVNKFQEPVKPGSNLGFILIKSRPDGADVALNGEQTGMKTPFQKALQPGQYSYELNQNLYLPYNGVFAITSGKTETVQAELIPNFGGLKLTTQPESDAEIIIDGKSMSEKSPANFPQLSPGTHSIEVKKEMFEPALKDVTIIPGKTQELSIAMTPTFGEVEITGPVGSTIWIDQMKAGDAKYNGRLLKGEHLVEVKFERYNDFSEVVNIEVGKRYPVQATLKPKTGTLSIMTDPPEADVSIDDVSQGKSPQFVQDIIIGEHTVKLGKAGFGMITKQITLTENQTLEINEKLPEGMQVEITSNPIGANLFIDNYPTGKTPYSGILSFGSHNLRVEFKGRETEQEVQIQQGGSTNFSLAISAYYTKPTSGLNFEMVFIQGGSFQMGSDDGIEIEKPVHLVTLSDFYIGKYEVTQKQWRDVMFNDPSANKYCDNCPVEGVSWVDVQKFIQRVNQKTGKNYRLPTEAEWEYAAKGGNKSRGYLYSGSNSLGLIGWYEDNSNSRTHPIGQKPANELGIYDMTGNVWEWCGDWYGDDYYKKSPTSNPKGPSSGLYRVLRGGGYSRAPWSCRTSSRFMDDPDYPGPAVGFKLVCTP